MDGWVDKWVDGWEVRLEHIWMDGFIPAPRHIDGTHTVAHFHTLTQASFRSRLLPLPTPIEQGVHERRRVGGLAGLPGSCESRKTSLIDQSVRRRYGLALLSVVSFLFSFFLSFFLRVFF